MATATWTEKLEHSSPSATSLPAQDGGQAIAKRHPQLAISPEEQLRITEETSLVDIIRAREQGMDIRQLAKVFRQTVQQFERTGMSLYRRTLLGASDAEARVHYLPESAERDMIMLASNNYLGLTNHPHVVAAAQHAALTFGTGAASAPLLVGTFPLTRKLENQLAELKHAQEACVFASGYQTNVGVISALTGKNDLVVIDQLGHASMWDGARMSAAQVRAFKHNDAEHLDRVLRRHTTSGLKLVCVEGLYSMDGDLPPLADICHVVRRHGALLLLDEAHSTGVLGRHGGGAAEHFGLEGEVDLSVGTLSKSLASCGGFVTGDHDLVTYIRYFARSAMFSAAPSPMVTAAASAALEAMQNEPERRQRLWENSRFMHAELLRGGFQTSSHASPILPVVVGSMKGLREMTLALHDDNVCVNSVPYPAVPHGSERLRISLTANHNREQLTQAAGAMRRAGEAAGVI